MEIFSGECDARFHSIRTRDEASDIHNSIQKLRVGSCGVVPTSFGCCNSHLLVPMNCILGQFLDQDFSGRWPARGA